MLHGCDDHLTSQRHSTQCLTIDFYTNLIGIELGGIFTPAWITSFLRNRTQSVIINNATSSSVPITSGVPQGTVHVLGPVLFLIFMNDLPDNIQNSIVRLFADDCILYRSVQVPNDCKKLHADINNLEQWEKTWLMKFNPTKCCVMTISLASKYKLTHNYIKTHGSESRGQVK